MEVIVGIVGVDAEKAKLQKEIHSHCFALFEEFFVFLARFAVAFVVPTTLYIRPGTSFIGVLILVFLSC